MPLAGARWRFDAAYQAKGTIKAKRMAPLFYCPNDKHIYIDLVFFDESKSKVGASSGPFVQAMALELAQG